MMNVAVISKVLNVRKVNAKGMACKFMCIVTQLLKNKDFSAFELADQRSEIVRHRSIKGRGYTACGGGGGWGWGSELHT